jgi:hypothetical protein
VTVQLGDLVTYRGIRCRIKRVFGDRCILTVLDPAPLSLRNELREPVQIRDLETGGNRPETDQNYTR